ncbi:LytR/AlgR family response regulator transcription factor [Cohaesibacter celericrescens]|uniref:DNA-binding response regulator n=1 Tax=Cohaesibacter celericrescens TaxID=2067669 RepID=A0A2N5XR17_9HYPH|nr:LytTR family DNA-binding domain-containing protein [Cohaesibacter celericrescens]PLW76868.1 DNA-binding response regulator [Cohaesibacter celericrescens]
MQIRCLIVDDEAPARDELKFLLSSHALIDVIGEAGSAAQAIDLCQQSKPDLVFLDIQMPGQDGFDVIRTLADCLPSPPLFVFITAYDSYAVKAFEASAVDYILKPVSQSRLATTIDRAVKLLHERQMPLQQQIESLLSQVTDKRPTPKPSRVSVEKNGRIRLIDPAEIIYCAYEDNRIMAYRFDSVLPIYGIASMDRMEEHLANSGFFRAHRATLVNLNAIREFSPWFNGKYSLVMNDQTGSELTVSRSRVKEFKDQLGL